MASTWISNKFENWSRYLVHSAEFSLKMFLILTSIENFLINKLIFFSSKSVLQLSSYNMNGLIEVNKYAVREKRFSHYFLVWFFPSTAIAWCHCSRIHLIIKTCLCELITKKWKNKGIDANLETYFAHCYLWLAAKTCL